MATQNHATHIHRHNYLEGDERIRHNERRTMAVVAVTAVAMVVEIAFGYWTGSMALLADGWHMASHVGALSIAAIAYRLARSGRFAKRFTFGTGKLIPLGGYTSAVILGIVAILMGVESISRYLQPTNIDFDTALVVAVLGLIVNIISALLLFDPHHHHDHHHGHGTHDHTHRGAYMHVITDALTSVFAIIGLLVGRQLGWEWADPAMGVVGSIVILKWSWSLLTETFDELLDAASSHVKEADIIALFSDLPGVTVTDVHVWKLAPKVLACEMMICSPLSRGSEFYRQRVQSKFKVQHLIIEERLCSK